MILYSEPGSCFIEKIIEVLSFSVSNDSSLDNIRNLV